MIVFLGKVAMFLICNTVCPTKVYGIENIPKEGAAIISGNHLSNWDIFLVGWKVKRHIIWLAKESLFRAPVVSFFVRAYGAIPVKTEGGSGMSAIMSALKVLKQDKLLGIFPEGMRTLKKKPSDYSTQLGIAMIMAKAKCPVVPVRIIGNMKPFRKIQVIFGTPISLEDYGGLDKKHGKEDLKQIAEDIMHKVYYMEIPE